MRAGAEGSLELVASRAVPGLLLALVAVFALVAISRLAGARQALVFPAIPVLAASALCWQAVAPLRWAPIAVLLALAAAAAFATWRIGVPRGRRPGALEALALVLLAVNLAYAALPDYRYDQWNYHLVVAKAVRSGPLEAPLLNDHLAFTGVWEYLYTLPRALWGDDVFNQASANAFSWLFVAVALYGLVVRLRSRAFPGGPAPLLVLVWVLFGLPDEPGLMSAKPDPVLLVAALAVIDLLTLPRSERSRADAALLAFFLVAPVGLKVTWVLFAAVAVPATLWVWRPPWARGTAAAAVAGAAAGAVVALPYLVKNALLFGDPVYPVQWPFHSSFWSAASEAYWRDMMAPARSLGAWWSTLERVPLGLAWHLFGVTLPVLLVGLLALVDRLGRGSSGPPTPRGFVAADARRLAIVSLGLAGGCVLLWPLFFHHGIAARFVFPCLAAALAALWVAMGTAWASITQTRRSFLATAVLFLPAVLYGHLPAKVERLATWPGWTMERLARDGPEEWRLWPEMRAINRDRRERQPGAAFGAGVTLVTVHGVYLLDGASLLNGGLEYRWYRERVPCLWRLLSDLDVRYLLLRTPGLETLPDLRPLEPGLIPLTRRGLALRVDRSTVERLHAEDPGCGEHPRT